MEKYQIVQVINYPSNMSTRLSDQSNQSSEIKNQVLQFQRIYSNQNDRKKYGKMKVLFQNDKFLFTLGPNYICFLISYMCFTMLDGFMIKLVWESTSIIWLKLLNVLITITQNYSYLSIALSNPGIQTKQTLPTDEDVGEQVKRFCKKCNIPMQKRTYHCRSCDVCIRQYDHHCPWVSKCIGQKNINKFRFFVCVTPCYIIYSMIIFMICMASNVVNYNESIKL